LIFEFVIRKTAVIPSLANANSKSISDTSSDVTKQRLVVVSLHAIRSALVASNLFSQEPRIEIADLTAGDEITATVIAKTQNGYALRIGNAMTELDLLGVSLEPGSKLRLRVIDSGSSSANLGQRIGQTIESTQFSNLGRILSQVVAPRGNGEELKVIVTAPVAANPGAEVEFAKALRHSITSSGLFYESHLKDWVNNQRALSEIRAEPQAKSVNESASAGAASVSTQQLTTDGAIPENVLPIVQHQLAALETHMGMWRTEVWPNQFAQLSIEQEDSPPTSPESDKSSWRASLKMQLPNLGSVEIAISLLGDRPQISVKTVESLAEKTLKGARATLIESLDGAGFTDAAIEVAHDAA
jgi:Flagellar hook-length control protein FliK